MKHTSNKGQSVFRAEKIQTYKTLIRPVTNYNAESWTLHKDIANQMVDLKKN